MQYPVNIHVCIIKAYNTVNICLCVDRFGLMERCWNGDPDQRPLYPDILQTLTTLLTHSDTNIVLDDLPCLPLSESEVDSEHNL